MFNTHYPKEKRESDKYLMVNIRLFLHGDFCRGKIHARVKFKHSEHDPSKSGSNYITHLNSCSLHNAMRPCYFCASLVLILFSSYTNMKISHTSFIWYRISCTKRATRPSLIQMGYSIRLRKTLPIQQIKPMYSFLPTKKSRAQPEKMSEMLFTRKNQLKHFVSTEGIHLACKFTFDRS